MTRFRHRPRSHPKPHTHGPPKHTADSRPAGREPEYVEGRLELKGKFGFVLSEDPALGDVLIQGASLRMAMRDDRVRARVTSSPGALRRSGEIVKVLQRAHETVVGAFRRLGNMPALVTENEDTVIRILDMNKFSPHVNDIVVVRITQWPSGKEAPAGVLTDVLGSRDTPGVDLKAIIHHYELPHEFLPEVEKEAESFGEEVPESAWRETNRELFFDKRVFTIDGADAKDFDDAVSLESTSTGWRLGVHIADVAHYVREGSLLDQEARRRGTSVYLTGSVLPMLPFPLSDNLCSLRPDRVRLTLSCVMDISQDGHIEKYRVVESAINSAKRFTYDEVEEILNGKNPPELDSRVISDVREMEKLARLMRAKRFERGSLDFDFPEPHVVLDMKGRPVDIRRRERLEAHRLIEDFMLLANETVARHMKNQPFIYRIHETPDPARLEKLKKSLDVVGMSLPKHVDTARPATLQKVLAAAEGKPVQPMVHLMVLRSLKQAVYSDQNKGHYGLASECYTHFTSPIRRYPDLIVHRLIKERLHHVQRNGHWPKELPLIAAHASKRERVAVEAEREFMDIQKVRLMSPHVGGEFTGVISGVTNFGFFVQLNEFFVEGLVHVTNLGNDYFIFDEARMTLLGRRTGRVFALGQKVKIRLAAANVLKHQLDFELLSADSERKQASHQNRPHPIPSKSHKKGHPRHRHHS